MDKAQEIAILSLPDLAEAEVVRINFDRLPPASALVNYLEDLERREFSSDRWLYKHRAFDKCNRCNGYGLPNPDWTPTDQDKSNPFTINAVRAGINWHGRNTTKVFSCRKSDIQEHVEIMGWEDLEYWTFYESDFVPCRHSFDVKALEALTVLAKSKPTENQIFRAYIRTVDGLGYNDWITAFAIFAGDGMRPRMSERKLFGKLRPIIEDFESKLESGELDDFIKSLRTPDFGDYPWSVKI